MVIPAFNAANTIEACLASVASQTLAPLEVVVVDDDSRDDTETAVAQCRAGLEAVGIALSYVRLSRNSGPSAARNRGIRESSGSYIAFLDADDTWSRRKLEVVDKFASGSVAGLLCHDYCEAPAKPCDLTVGDFVIKPLSIGRLLLRNPGQTSCAVVRRQDMLAFNETMRYCEDYDLWLRVAEHSPVLQLVGGPLTCLGRPQLSAGGLSASTVRMRIGEAHAYYNFCMRVWPSRIFLLPGLLFFSLMKHAYSRVGRWLR